jgi:hypothetical protein
MPLLAYSRSKTKLHTMKRSILILIGLMAVICNTSYSQIRNTPSIFAEGNESVPPAENTIQEKEILYEKALDVSGEKESSFLQFRDQMTGTLRETLSKEVKREEFHFNPVKSLNGNIKFGGFYNGGIDLFVAPDMYIQPFNGISIYAIRRKHTFIPLEKVQENIQPILLETVCLAAIENAVNYFTVGDKVLNGILNFALKNGFTLLSQAMKDTEDKKNRLPTWESYYFSIGVRF